MEEIIKGLYLGSDDDVAEAKRRGYARLAACKDGPDGHRTLLGYTSLGAPKGKDYLFARKGDWMALNLIDSEDPTMIPDKVLDKGIEFIKEQHAAGKTVFVHCNAGRSRSCGLVMLYLRSINELPPNFKRALHVFSTIYRPCSLGHGMEYHVRSRW